MNVKQILESGNSAIYDNNGTVCVLCVHCRSEGKWIELFYDYNPRVFDGEKWCMNCDKKSYFQQVTANPQPVPQAVTIFVDDRGDMVTSEKAKVLRSTETIYAVQVLAGEPQPFNDIDNMYLAIWKPSGALWGGVPQSTQMEILRKMYDADLLGQGDYYDSSKYL